MVGHEVAGVPDDPVALPDPPRQLDALMGVEEQFRQPPAHSNTSRGIAVAPSQTLNTALLCRGSPLRMRGSTGWVGRRLRIGDRAGSARTGVVREHLRDPRQSVGFGKPRVVVEEIGRRGCSPRRCDRRDARCPAARGRGPRGQSGGYQPLPTTTMSVVTPVCARTDCMALLSSAGRRPWVSSTTA